MFLQGSNQKVKGKMQVSNMEMNLTPIKENLNIIPETLVGNFQSSFSFFSANVLARGKQNNRKMLIVVIFFYCFFFSSSLALFLFCFCRFLWLTVAAATIWV